METLTLRSDGREPSLFDRFDPRLRAAVGFAGAFVCTAVGDWRVLALVAFPACVWIGIFGLRAWWRRARLLVYPSLFLLITLTFTWSVPGSPWWLPTKEGLLQGLLINLRTFTVAGWLFPLVVSLGLWNLEEVLERAGAPFKLRALFVLTVRYVFMLNHTFTARLRAFGLRAHGAPFGVRMQGLAALVGTTLIHCSDRAARAWQAIQVRGGLDGLSRRSPWHWRRRDSLAGAISVVFFLMLGVGLWCLKSKI